MSIRLIDPEASKVVNVSGTDITIKPLHRIQKAKLQYMWMELFSNEDEKAVDQLAGAGEDLDEVEAAKELRKAGLAYAKYKTIIDQDEITKIICPCILNIDLPGVSNPADFLNRIQDPNIYWEIYEAISNWTSIDEDTENFLESSPAQSTVAPAEESVQKNVAKEKGSASTTSRKVKK